MRVLATNGHISSGEARLKLMVVLIRDVATGEGGGVRPPNLGFEKIQVKLGHYIVKIYITLVQ